MSTYAAWVFDHGGWRFMTASIVLSMAYAITGTGQHVGSVADVAALIPLAAYVIADLTAPLDAPAAGRG